jgi:hypothetical protein
MLALLRGYKRRMGIVLGPFFKVSCNGPDCQSELRVSAKVGDSPRSMAEKVRDLLSEAGWTKDAQGIDRCPECSQTPAALRATQPEQHGSESEEGVLEP